MKELRFTIRACFIMAGKFVREQWREPQMLV